MSSQHAVIIGGTSGIGLATARHLLDLDIRVTIAGRDPAKLKTAVSALGGGEAIALDARDDAAVRKAFVGMGSVDHLVLALGGNRGIGPIASLPLEILRAPFEDKVYPQIACVQAALPVLSRTASITLLSAVSAQAAMPGTAALAAANAAIEALVPVLAVELKPMRVNAVSPGVIDTSWWDFAPPEQKAAMFANFAERTPVGRIGGAEDVAQAVVFLVRNSFMSGHVLVCDGGARLGTG